MFFLFLMVALLFALSVNLISQEKKEIPKKAVKLVEKAAEDIKAQKFDKAGEKLAEAKELAPEYPSVYVQLSALSQQNQNQDEAMAYLAKAYELDPTSDAIVHQYGILILKVAQQKMASNDMQSTLAMYEKFIALPGIKAKMSPQYIQVAYTLAGSYLQANKPDDVIRYANEVLTTPGVEAAKQQYLFSYFILGSAYGQKNDSENSISNLKKFLELNVENILPVQYVGMANFLIASNYFVALEGEIDKMKKDDLEGIKKAAESKADMVKYLNDALLADPTNQDAKFAMAKYHYYCQDHDKALALISELQAAVPGNNDYKQVFDIVSKAKEAKKKK